MLITVTKEEIIFKIIIPTIIAFSSVLFGIIVSIYVKHNIPDTKILNSYIKKCFRFTVAYILPISLIILSFVKDDFDKFFIFKVLILTIAITINFLFQIVKTYIHGILDILRDVAFDLDKKRDIDIKIVTVIREIINKLNSDDKKQKPKR